MRRGSTAGGKVPADVEERFAPATGARFFPLCAASLRVGNSRCEVPGLGTGGATIVPGGGGCGPVAQLALAEVEVRTRSALATAGLAPVSKATSFVSLDFAY